MTRKSHSPDPERPAPEALEPDVLVDEKEEEEEEPLEELGQDLDALDSGPVLDIATFPTSPVTGETSPSLPVLRRAEGYGRATLLERFLAEVGRFPVLSIEEERELAERVSKHNDPVAARKLIVHNLRLVVKMAYKYRRTWASVLDLIQEGNIGLVEAVGRFDPFRGARFSTYASYWIRAYMIRYLLEHSRMVRISRTRAGRKLFFRLSKEREKLRALGIEAGPKLLAERLGVTEKDFEEVVRHMDQPELRLDAPIASHDHPGDTVLDTFAAAGPSPESMAHQHALSAEIGQALDEFAKTLQDPREKAAWDEHLMADDPVSLSELGSRYGVTKQRMGQIVNAIRKRLKKHLTETFGPDVQLQLMDRSE